MAGESRGFVRNVEVDCSPLSNSYAWREASGVSKQNKAGALDLESRRPKLSLASGV
jgi:hypothetical protein